MARKKPAPFLKIADLFVFLLFLAIGFSAVAVPTAYGGIASAGTPRPPVARQSAALDEAQAACNVMTTRSGSRVSECHVLDWNPSLDVVVPARRDEAVKLCDATARAIAAKSPHLAGKNWKLRLFSSAAVPPTAACRVP